MTQIERYAQMMKIEVENVTATIALHVASEGSVLRQTVQARADKIEIHYEIESSHTPAEVAGLLRNTRNGCYVRQTIADPKLFHDTVNLNGSPFNMDDYPAPTR